jgi:peptide/nickel transport system permease protein
MSKPPLEMAPETPSEPSVQPSPPTRTSARRVVWARRRRTIATHWRTYRSNRQGVVGLAILAVFGILALIGPFIVNQSGLVAANASAPPFHAPSWQYPLGTDNFGRSVLGLVVMGSRISLLVGLTATVGAMVIGAAVGITSGYFGGTWIDTVLNAITNWVLVLPWVVLAIVLSSLLGRTLFNIILVIAITSWASTARVVRAQALSVRERPYVERAKALGASTWHIVTRHIFPNVAPVLLANAVLTVALVILSETTLSILGLGDPNAVSWGRIIEESFNAGALSAGWWWWLIPPGIAIVLVTLAFTMCGYAIDEVLNPKLRRR